MDEDQQLLVVEKWPSSDSQASSQPPLVGPLGAKAVAAVTGAVSTSLLMTPFDVLKTRMQTHRPGSASASGSGGARPTGSGAGGRIVMPADVCCQTAIVPPIASTSSSSSSTPSSNAQSTARSAITTQCFSASSPAPAPSSSSISSPFGSSSSTTTHNSSLPSSARPATATIPPSSSTTTLLQDMSSHLRNRGPSSLTLTLTPSLAHAHAHAQAPVGCLHPSKWAGIWGETVSFDEAMEIIAARRGQGAGAGASAGASVGGGVARVGAGAGGNVGGTIGEGFWNEIGLVMKESGGWRGLWKGVGTSLTMSIPSAAIYMIGYEYLVTALAPHLSPQTATATATATAIAPSSSLSPPSTQSETKFSIPSSSATIPTSYLSTTPFVAGSLARTLSATVVSPMELFRTRLQALPQAGQPPPTYSTTFISIRSMVQAQGLSALWRGLGPTLWRDVPFSGIYWAGFESLKVYLSSSSSPISLAPGLGTTFISGAASGMIASILTSPFDVLKTRRQVFTPSPHCDPKALHHPASTMPLLAHIVKTEGWRALFAGIVPRTAKVAPACGIMIGCYEGVGRYLGGKTQ